MRWPLSSLLLLASCGGVPAEQGLDSVMLVEGARFVAGPMPGASGGPKVVALDLSSNAVRPGKTGAPLRGSLDPGATAAAIGLVGDRGYWVVAAGLADVSAPGFPTFGVSLSFSERARAGTYQLLVQAVDADKHFGAAEPRTLTVTDALTPEGALVISLSWDTQADLDLHVVDPAGTEIWKGDISSQTPDAGASFGLLDIDSNAACVIDGRRRENVSWQAAPPAGHYVVRVDTFSLCGEVSASWHLEVRRDGAVIGRAQGVSVDNDQSQPHGRGAGLLALELDVP